MSGQGAAGQGSGQGSGQVSAAQGAQGEAREGHRPGRPPPRDRRDGGRPPEGRGPERRGPDPREDRRPPRRERAPDPDSPFAKLLALKAQLESQDGGKR